MVTTRQRSVALMILAILAGGCDYGSSSAVPGAPAPPRPNYNVSGTVLEVTGQPIAEAAVKQWGQTVMTDAAGRFTFVAPYGAVSIEVSKAGYETRTYDRPVDHDREYDLVLRREFPIAAGESATITLDSLDGSYEFDRFYERCEAPCKLIRIDVPVRGRLSITIATLQPNGQLWVFTGGGATARCCEPTVTIENEAVEAGPFLMHVTVTGAPDRVDPRITIATSFAPR